jgi:hypothetical protein
MFTALPSSRLQSILDKNNLNNYKYAMEYDPKNKIELPIKATLNSLPGAYVCINLVNGNMYVGSASINCMYRRYAALPYGLIVK